MAHLKRNHPSAAQAFIEELPPDAKLIAAVDLLGSQENRAVARAILGSASITGVVTTWLNPAAHDPELWIVSEAALYVLRLPQGPGPITGQLLAYAWSLVIDAEFELRAQDGAGGFGLAMAAIFKLGYPRIERVEVIAFYTNETTIFAREVLARAKGR